MDFATILTLGAPIIAGVARNLAGWIESSAKDGKRTSYEWKQLLATTMQVAVIGYSTMLVGVDPLVSAGVGVLGSIGISTAKKIGSA